MFRTKMGKDGLTQTVRELQTVSNAIGFKYIPSGTSQRDFFAEIIALISHITREVDIHCLSLDGAPLVAHGLNNACENGYYLLFRKEITGYTRQVYRAVAQTLGYSNDQADIAYGVVDIGLSGYGMVRPVVKADSFRLFRHINTDYIRGWQDMGRVALTGELAVDALTIYGIHQIRRGNE